MSAVFAVLSISLDAPVLDRWGRSVRPCPGAGGAAGGGRVLAPLYPRRARPVAGRRGRGAPERGGELSRLAGPGTQPSSRPPGSWTPLDLQALLTIQLVDPERFVSDGRFARGCWPVLPRSLDPSCAAAPPRRSAPRAQPGPRDRLRRLRGDRVRLGGRAAPGAGAARRLPVAPGAPLRRRRREPVAASVYSLPSFFFSRRRPRRPSSPECAGRPRRTGPLIVLTDLPLRRRLEAQRPEAAPLETYGRPYSPWPRDPFSLVRAPSGAVRVAGPPEPPGGAGGGREPRRRADPEPAGRPRPRLGRSRLERGAGVLPQRAGAGDARRGLGHPARPGAAHPRRSWLDRVPVESFGDGSGIERYVDRGRDRPPKELGILYGRPVRFVHPLSGRPDGRALMRRIGGGAGYDLDSLVTLLPAGKGFALVADADAGRELLSRMTPRGLEGLARRLRPARGPSATASPGPVHARADLDSFLDLVAEHLRKRGDGGAAGCRCSPSRSPLLREPGGADPRRVPDHLEQRGGRDPRRPPPRRGFRLAHPDRRPPGAGGLRRRRSPARSLPAARPQRRSQRRLPLRLEPCARAARRSFSLTPAPLFVSLRFLRRQRATAAGGFSSRD